MHKLSDPAIEAILKEWDIAEYDPPNTDIREWNRAVETRALCGMPEFLTSVLLTLLVTVSNSWGCGTAEGPVTNIG